MTSRALADARSKRSAVFAVLVLAAVVRVLAIASEPAYLHPDALYQGLEPAYWLLFDHGVLPWEFREGLRSWAWPGVLAVPMAVGKAASGWQDTAMAAPVFFVRGFVAGIDLVGVALAMRLARDHAGTAAALATGAVLGLHPAFVVMATNPLIDVPSATCLLWLCERALTTAEVERRRGVAIGAAGALAIVLRIQLLPAVLAVAWILVRRTRAGRIAWAAHSRRDMAIAVGAVLLSYGALDLLTWGSPIASTWGYVLFNLQHGTRFGTMPADRYAREALEVFPIAWPALLVFFAVGARRAGALALVAVAFLVPHQLIELRVWRFIHPGLVLVVVIVGIGVGRTIEAIGAKRAGLARALAFALALSLSGELWVAGVREVPWSTTWLVHQGGELALERSRGLHRAFLKIGAAPRPRAVVQTVLPAAAAPGHALLGHDVAVVAALEQGVALETARRADVWIQPAASPPPPGFARVWCDAPTQVCIDRETLAAAP